MPLMLIVQKRQILTDGVDLCQRHDPMRVFHKISFLSHDSVTAQRPSAPALALSLARITATDHT